MRPARVCRRAKQEGRTLLRKQNIPWWVPAVLCSLLLAVCVLVVHPAVATGVNDDFTYSWSARVLADTGRVTYSGWGAVLLGWQLYWGALFIKLFGFSFGVLRLSIFLVALGTTAFLDRVFVRSGLSERNAAIATLTIVLSPVFLPLSFSFMSDVPALLCFLLCLYGCLRALEAKVDRAALGWLAFAALSNAVVGTVRQITWLGVLVLVPTAVWLMRRRRGAVLLGAVLWLACAGWVMYWLHWFKRQPYAIIEGVRTYQTIPFASDAHSLLLGAFCLLPVLIAFVVKFPFRVAWKTTIVAIAAVAVPVTAVLSDRSWMAPFSVDAVTARGVDIPSTLLGYRPDVMPLWFRVVCTAVMAAAVCAVVFWIASTRTARRSVEVQPVISDRELYTLLVPYSVVYVSLITTRQVIFDRYWLPMLVVYLIVLTRVYQKVAAQLPAASLALLIMMALFSVISTHDLYATYRARLGAIDEVRAAGVPRDAIDGGAEYDGWTESEIAGHVNNGRITNPAGSYVPVPPTNLPKECTVWYRKMFPHIHPRYLLSYEPVPCFRESEFAPFAYRTWLEPRERYIYISAAR